MPLLTLSKDCSWPQSDCVEPSIAFTYPTRDDGGKLSARSNERKAVQEKLGNCITFVMLAAIAFQHQLFCYRLGLRISISVFVQWEIGQGLIAIHYRLSTEHGIIGATVDKPSNSTG